MKTDHPKKIHERAPQCLLICMGTVDRFVMYNDKGYFKDQFYFGMAHLILPLHLV